MPTGKDAYFLSYRPFRDLSLPRDFVHFSLKAVHFTIVDNKNFKFMVFRLLENAFPSHKN